jgi:hypothetical protein
MSDRDPIFVTISFEPQAIRDHFDMDDEMQERLQPLTDEQLYEAAEACIASSDVIWERFHEWCLDIVEAAENPNEGELDE